MNQKKPNTYRPIWKSEFKLPEKYRMAAYIIINVEYFEYATAYPADPSDIVPNVLNYGWRDYGTRVGIWRIFDILDKYKIKPMVALNSSICEKMPDVVDAIVERDMEIICHGVTNSKRLGGLDMDQEREMIKMCKNQIKDATGISPKSWLGPGLSETFDTLDILVQEGFEYVFDWCNDDHPYLLETESGEIMSMPYSNEINDVSLFTRRNLTGEQFQKTVTDQFEVLYEEGNRVMPFAIHSYITGQAFRSKYFEEIIKMLDGYEDIWWPGCGAIGDQYKKENTKTAFM